MQHRVFSSNDLLQYILSYAPIDTLYSCSIVNNDWHLITKYMLPISLLDLRTLLMGELLYWLPGENKFPKTVLLKLKLSSGQPQSVTISTSVKNNKDKDKSNTGIVSTSGHYQILELNEILFIIDGHWTPIFEQLHNETVEETFDSNESEFFHRSKCFSIVTNTYMTYDFISFNPQTNQSIVTTLRKILGKTHELCSKMAIFAKANKKYDDGINQTPLIFKDTLSALNFEMFVLILQDCMNKISAELNIDIPSIITTQANASLLYPMIVNENIVFTEWSQWCRTYILTTLKDYEYVSQNMNENENGNENGNEKEESMDPITPPPAMHNRRQSSLFGQKAFPTDQIMDLFTVQKDSFSDMDIIDDFEQQNGNAHYNGQENCLVM